MFGRFLSFSINTWMRITGRSVDLAQYPWLDGPIGENYIGETFYQEYAKNKGYIISVPPGSGLMADTVTGEQVVAVMATTSRSSAGARR